MRARPMVFLPHLHTAVQKQSWGKEVWETLSEPLCDMFLSYLTSLKYHTAPQHSTQQERQGPAHGDTHAHTRLRLAETPALH